MTALDSRIARLAELAAAGPGVEEIAAWVGLVHLPRPAAAVLLDRTGRLTEAAGHLAEFRPPDPAPTARLLIDGLTNWTLMLAHILARGETARAHNLLHAVVAPLQLQLCRLLRDSTAHWLTPSRALERDLPAPDIARYTTTTARALPDEVRAAASASWTWSRELAEEAAARWDVTAPTALHKRISALLAQP